MKDKKMQCKDIPTLPILEYVSKYGGIGCVWWEGFDRSVRHVMPKVDDALALAKMRNLMLKGYVNGCPCGCRGDFELTDKGKHYMAQLMYYTPSKSE